jgi:magnesium chelatase subunit D
VTVDTAAMAARLFAVDPVGLGGVLLQSAAGEARDAWLRHARDLMDSEAPWRRVPSHIDGERLLGGLDLAATLAAGLPVQRRGVLAEADGGVLVLCMAERVGVASAARIAAVQEAGAVGCDGPARWGLVALDESEAGDEGVARVLADRLALHVRLAPMCSASQVKCDADSSLAHLAIEQARARLGVVRASDAIVIALCEAAQVLGVDSLRACCLALRVACAAAALRGSGDVEAEDAAWAACFVLGPRARAWPAGPDPVESTEQDASTPPDPASAAADSGGDAREPADATPEPSSADASSAPYAAEPSQQASARPMEEALIEAAGATLPSALLAAIAASKASGAAPRSGARVARSGRASGSPLQGRPLGARHGELRAGARLDLLQTLTAAAPWQPLRRRERATHGHDLPGAPPAILVRRGDFHVRRFRMREESTTIFAVDASGSQALHRLAEAKGAAELLLADCYVRRDRVAVLAFRGEGATVLLPPTRSLVRAKRCLAALPGGGATPLAAGLDVARELAQGIVRQGGTPLLVLLTDGKANMTRSGQPGRVSAQVEALAAARAWRATGLGALLLDTAPEPQARARELADAMQARYVALPHADSRSLARAIDVHRNRSA